MLGVTRYLTVGQVLLLHRALISRYGGPVGVRDLAALEAAIGRPRQSFDGRDLYPSLATNAIIRSPTATSVWPTPPRRLSWSSTAMS